MMMIPKINRQQLKHAIHMAVHTLEPIMIVGSPGCGKTQITEQTAKSLTPYVYVSTPAIEDPTDSAGMPVYNQETNQVRFMPFKLLEALINHSSSDPAVVIMDDFGQAPRSVQNAKMQLIQDRRVGEHQLPDNIVFIMLTNEGHQAGANPITEPVKSRCMAIYQYELELEEWIDWAYQRRLYPTIMPYLRFKPKAFNDFKPTTELINQPCPRTWHKLSKALYAMDQLNIQDEGLRYATAVGSIAEYASEFIEFERSYRKLPDPKAVIEGSVRFEHDPADPSLTYALCGAVVRYTNKKNLRQVIALAKTLPEIYQAALMADLRSAEPQFIESNAFMDWTLRHADII